ncbi:type II/IV secretion system protein [Hyphomonas neptunium ATCC 15444]|uniref:Type II/IV secretion system protein n=2 Tax=Hyphomonas TaxID=85 RepID=Q0C321_HYPNA|nr:MULTISPECIES: CpaF family protein [Hyphomonas]ABI77351.1 type II/IV secretion system protein [Hyphomonas neptunium ATCC 15444]KCZ95891.1 type II/IV secretion system protein [Hyphomonas hirschiana VP5]
MSRFGFTNAAPKVAEAVPAPVAPQAAPAVSPKQTQAEQASFDLLDAKLRVHAKLIDELDLSALDKLDDETMRRRVRGIISEIIRKEEMALSAAEEASFADAVMDEMTGLGPIEPLLKDDSIADILINGCNQVYIERGGKLQLAPVRFADNDHLLRIVQRIVAAVGRRVDESQPLVDARLLDGSRVNAAVAPIAIDGPLVSIRKFSKSPLTMDKLVAFGAIPKPVAEFILGAVKCRASTVISGGTGSGKTTLLNALSAAINPDERLITIEDAAELQLQQPHVARMETRPPNIEGKGEIRQRELVKNALRMRPDRVILGEVRSEEAFDMLQAMNTGHEGSMATIHANNPRDAITRLEQMVMMGGMKISEEAIRGQIASAVNFIVQATRLSDGSRKVISIAEITGMEGSVVQLQEIFKFERTGTTPEGKVQGHFVATGLRPKFVDEMERKGVFMPAGLFDPSSKF